MDLGGEEITGMRSFAFRSIVAIHLQITVTNKARLFAVKMNKKDRKSRAEVETCNELKTPEEFWLALTGFSLAFANLDDRDCPLQAHRPDRKRRSSSTCRWTSSRNVVAYTWCKSAWVFSSCRRWNCDMAC